jgi:crotonobetainyl-CoA:carnitine CoA-transferase CaiB-like acyl-CoA transferase
VAAPGADEGAVEWPPRPVAAAGTPALPLAGVRIVDLTAWWAGPMATHLLATLGADVIKVESVPRPDLMRCAGPKTPADADWLEWGPIFHVANTNKRGVTLDLTTEEGREGLLDVLATADLLVENFTPRVMEQFDLGWERLHARFPRLGMVRMCAFGLDGPWRDNPGFAQTMESLSGLAWLTGRADGPPTLVGGAGDPTAGVHAAFAAVLAVEACRDDGEGHLVEATMVEAVLNVAAPLVIHQQASDELLGRRADHGLFRTRGEDAWVAIDGPSAAVAEILGGTDIAEWDGAELVERLVAAGIPAPEVIAPYELADNPQLRHRHLFEPEHHPVTGTHDVPGLPFRFGNVPAWIRRPAPTLGQHDDEVLRPDPVRSP